MHLHSTLFPYLYYIIFRSIIQELIGISIVTGETIQGETADKKEEELSSGALLYPKWTDYDVYNAKDTKIVVLEKEDIEYNWRNAYLKLVEDMETSGTLSRCALLYIDNDDIPELYIVPSYTDCGKIYSFHNGKLIENTSFNADGYSLDYYVERKGKLCGRMIPIGGIHLLYQEYKNGEFKDILYASCTGYETWDGTINDIEVTEQEYNSQVDAVDERENATPIVLKSYQEIVLELMDTSGNSGTSAEIIIGVVITQQDALNVRFEPSTDSDILGTVPKNAEVYIIGESNDWYMIEYGTNIGYVLKEYIELV